MSFRDQLRAGARVLAKVGGAGGPAQLIFFVTNRCNARCKHCFYWRETNTQGKDLSLAEITKISRSMGRLIWLYLSGGEPFLRADLAKVCHAFYQNNRPLAISIPTNGLAGEAIINQTAEICSLCPKTKVTISVSVDDLGQRHDQMRGVVGTFSKIEKLLPRLKELQKFHPNLGVQINIVFCHQNQDRVGDIYSRLEKRFAPDNITVSLIRGEPREVSLIDIDMEKYKLMHLKMENKRRFRHYPGFFGWLVTKKEDYQARLFYRLRQLKKPLVRCLVNQTVVLYPNGELAMCELRKERYGNLRQADYDFTRLWQSAKAKKIREKARGCYCTHECVYGPNIFLNPLVWPRWGWFILTGGA